MIELLATGETFHARVNQFRQACHDFRVSQPNLELLDDNLVKKLANKTSQLLNALTRKNNRTPETLGRKSASVSTPIDYLITQLESLKQSTIEQKHVGGSIISVHERFQLNHNIFEAIKAGNFEVVQELIKKNPKIVNQVLEFMYYLYFIF